MPELNLNAYREALEADAVVIDGVRYPLRTLVFAEAMPAIERISHMDFASPAEVESFLAEFAELSGLPLDLVRTLSAGELEAVARFFSECQKMTPERYRAARTTPAPSPAPASTPASSTASS